MELTQLNRYILENAPSNICDPGIEGVLHASSVDDLLSLYKQNIDYVLSEGYPTKNDLQRFAGARLADHGIYIDTTIAQTIHEKGFLVLLGSCTGTVICQGFSATEMYIKNSSQANVQVSNSAFVTIDVFDNTHLTIHNSGIGRVLVNVYGNAVVQSSGQVKVVKKHKRNY